MYFLHLYKYLFTLDSIDSQAMCYYRSGPVSRKETDDKNMGEEITVFPLKKASNCPMNKCLVSKCPGIIPGFKKKSKPVVQLGII